jgi:hypothetical protein
MFDPDVDYVMVDFIASNTITPASMQTGCITSDELASSALLSIYTRVWGDSLATPGQTARRLFDPAYYLKDSTWAGRTAYGGWIHKNLGNNGVGPLDSAAMAYLEVQNIDAWNPATDLAGVDTASIRAAVWGVDSATARTVAGSIGNILGNPAYVQGAASLTAAEVADTVWGRDSASARTVAGSMGFILALPSFVQGAAAGFDSAACYGAIEQASVDFGFTRFNAPDSISSWFIIDGMKIDSGLNIVANRGDDSGALHIKNNSTQINTAGIYAQGYGGGLFGYATYSGGSGIHGRGATGIKGSTPSGVGADFGHIVGYIDSLGAGGKNAIAKMLNDSDFVRYNRDTTAYGVNLLNLNQLNVIGRKADSGVGNFINTYSGTAYGLFNKAYTAGQMNYGSGDASNNGIGIYNFGENTGAVYAGLDDYGIQAISLAGRGAHFGGSTYGATFSGGTYDFALVSSGNAQGYFDVDFDSRAGIADSVWADSAQKALVVGTLPYALAAVASTNITNESISNQVTSDWLALLPGDTTTGTLLSEIAANAAAGGTGGTGTGGVLLIYHLWDDSNGTAIPYADVTFYTISGTFYARPRTSASGYVTISANTGDSLTAISYAPGYIFAKYDTIVVGAAPVDYDTLNGYLNVPTGKVYAYIDLVDIPGLSITRDAKLTIWLKSDFPVQDTCYDKLIAANDVKTSKVDAYGRLGTNLLCSGCLDGGTYTGEVRTSNKVFPIGAFTVSCDSTVYHLTVNRQ